LRFEIESGSGELLKRDCPIRRHLKVLMEVDEDDEEEGAHVCPITCAELLSGEILIALREGNWDTLDTQSCGQLEV
jgi:hypothetical protein